MPSLRLTLTLLIVTAMNGSSGTPSAYGQARHRKTDTNTALGKQIALSSREIADRVLQALVLIVAQDRNGKPLSLGTGFFFGPRIGPDSPNVAFGINARSDLIATNLHVLERASQGYIKTLKEGVTYKIDRIVEIDMVHDLCVFKATGASARPLTLGSNRPGVGDDVFVGGNPQGLEASVSKGIVSAVRRDEGLLQIDAAISPGSSGGPVVDSRAEVLGITVSSLVEGQNLNFAIDVSHLAALHQEWDLAVYAAGALALKDRKENKLKGPVRSVTTSVAKCEYNERAGRYVEGPAELTTKAFYDVNGNLTDSLSQVSQRNLQGSAQYSWKMHCEYSALGFKVRQSSENPGQPQEDKTFTMAEAIQDKINGTRFSGTWAEGSGETGDNDQDGNLIEWNNPSLNMKTVFKYDQNGWKVDEMAYKDGKLQFAEHYDYQLDGHGNWVECHHTSYIPEHPNVGYFPTSTIYRTIMYYNGSRPRF